MEDKFDRVVSLIHGRGGRMTAQRKTLLKVILANPSCTCKELFYLSRKEDCRIGRATVYRTIKILEEYGIIAGRRISIQEV